MKNKRAWLFAASLLFLSGLGVAKAQTAHSPAAKAAPDGCEQFKGIVVKPDNPALHKMRVLKPTDAENHKGIVVNPCEKKTLVRGPLLLIKPGRHQTKQTPEDKNPSVTARPKHITDLVNSSEMLKRAQQEKEPKK
jgi:hypothetical protein